MIEKVVKITNNGMISIPASIRKKYNLQDGDKVLIIDDETDSIKIFLVENVEELRKRSFTTEEFRKIYNQSRKEDIEQEK
ncbi:MAG TPA: AbrB/MazE/SpoVT family DNA-binding domain-containing protein [Candidatus Lokiarchaeia archaeon]